MPLYAGLERPQVCSQAFFKEQTDTKVFSVRDGLRNNDPAYKNNINDFPGFLWYGCVVDRANLAKGFGRGELPIQVCCTFYFQQIDFHNSTQTGIYVLWGPSAAQKASETSDPTGRGNHKPRAVKWRARSTTPGMIASCAVLVCTIQ